jgi:hypothetical protein
MISTLTQGDPAQLRIGMAVQLVCERVDDTLTLPRFRLVA